MKARKRQQWFGMSRPGYAELALNMNTAVELLAPCVKRSSFRTGHLQQLVLVSANAQAPSHEWLRSAFTRFFYKVRFSRSRALLHKSPARVR